MGLAASPDRHSSPPFKGMDADRRQWTTSETRMPVFSTAAGQPECFLQIVPAPARAGITSGRQLASFPTWGDRGSPLRQHQWLEPATMWIDLAAHRLIEDPAPSESACVGPPRMPKISAALSRRKLASRNGALPNRIAEGPSLAGQPSTATTIESGMLRRKRPGASGCFTAPGDECTIRR